MTNNPTIHEHILMNGFKNCVHKILLCYTMYKIVKSHNSCLGPLAYLLLKDF